MMHPDDMTKDIETVLVPEEKLREQIHEMGARNMPGSSLCLWESSKAASPSSPP